MVLYKNKIWIMVITDYDEEYRIKDLLFWSNSLCMHILEMDSNHHCKEVKNVVIATDYSIFKLHTN